MIVLATNVISELFKPQPDRRVVAWLESLGGGISIMAIHTADDQIAAICRVHGATCATRNTRDFAQTGVELLNPWGT